MTQFDQFAGLPGIDSQITTVESVITWGPPEQQLILPVPISGAARDAGHSGQTNVLRPGLLMGIIKATRLAIEWTSGAADGSEVIAGPLLYAVNTQKDGANATRWMGYILIKGNVQSSKLIIPGQANAGIDGNGSEAAIRTAMFPRFILDDQFYLA